MNIHSGLESTQSLPLETPVTRTGGVPADPGASTPAAEASVVADGDTTSLSEAARSAAASSSVSDVRSEKVASIQQALANGSYAVAASDVAGKLIDHLLQN